VDRGGRELPIQPDIAGLTITVPAGQVVRVSVQERDGKDAVELVPKATT
ncbi:MAG: bifunctional pyr operon transcriptional regulator/uracil phosphoribosyltransferase, partial [Gemmatimonadetes bacterium]|nr:bifunctional pyr operon transcriptional regulator/uracil phosphoribosyltransferase [Gemmatimonadota bacterium]